MNAVLFTLLLASACKKAEGGYCKDPIVKAELSHDVEKSALKVRVSLGKVLALSFPEGLALARPPVLGNEAFYTVSWDDKSSLLVTVWAKLPEGSESLSIERLEELSTSNLQIALESGETVSVGLRFGRTGVELVVFEARGDGAERAYLRKALADQAARLKANHLLELEAAKAKAEEDAERALGLAFLSGEPECASTFDRSMDRFLIVTARTICRVGTQVIAAFTIQNRAREDVFKLEKVEVLADDDEEDTTPNIEARLVHENDEAYFLRFNEERRSAVVFTLKEAWEAARSYQIRVRESGGKKRVVTVEAEF